MSKTHRIILTGGPSGGKSTALARVKDRFENLGFKVFCVPEAATLLILGGYRFTHKLDDNIVLESNLLQTQMRLEQAFYQAAALQEQPSIVLCDRGTMDSSAFMEPGAWQAVLDMNGWTTVGLRDKHYDAVIHMVTAADGAEEFYTLANNAARSETPEQAREIDKKLIKAWTGHPHLRIIDNSTDFDNKVRRVIDAICRVVGIPNPVEIERKYLVKRIESLPVHHETVDIEQIYLKTTDNSFARVRRRGQNGSYTYFHTIKRPITSGQRIEEEHQISPKEYSAYLRQADPEMQKVQKTRTCFFWENQYFELDRFQHPNQGLIFLEAELDSIDQPVKIPPFIEIVRDVTDEPEFSNAAIARKPLVSW